MLDIFALWLRFFFISKTMRSILKPLNYVEDSQKVFKGRLIKTQTHALGLHSPSIFQKELLDSAEHCDLA